ncbi:hypothetical protein DRW07_13550 [Alteromonas sediminis]|uniref:Copper chaperone PCu(A)C n=1 Tax=Alteromonas sediminis TaxID=2259342 RepID=A0A3N5YLA1_9ALTE|nr:hypothetical protein [Alteromonas sediminis]RPJ65831.1 hypothetical protein DRW07_13550 [Alteromonas sediminis]
MKYSVFWLLLLLGFCASFQAFGRSDNSSIRLLTDRSRATNELRVYIQNVGNEDISIVTSGLSVMVSSDRYEVSPDRHVLVGKEGLIELKESLADYSLVLLRPGETTYLKGVSINAEKGTVQYYVKASWAELHQVWGGRIEATF